MPLLPLVALTLLSTPQSAAQTADYAKLWDSVQSAIKSRYYARQTRAAEMDLLLAKYAPKAKAARTREEFSKAVNDMIDDFGDSHFDLFTTDDQGFYVMDGLSRGKSAAQMPNVGAWFKPAPGGGWQVQYVLDGTPAERAGLRKGDVVTLADGAPFGPITSFRGKDGKRVALTFKRPTLGPPGTMSVDVEVRDQPAMEMFLEASKDSSHVIETGGKKIGYFHLWTQSSDEFRNALAAEVYGKLRDTDGFVLDLRDGFGGRPEGFGDPFFRPDVRLDWKVGDGGFTQAFGYQKPLVVLINGGSRSAKEVLAYVFKKSGRATLIGSTTAGNVLGTSPARLGEWAYLEIPMVEVYADGVRLEKVGVAPNIVVQPEYDNGKDLVLAKAIEFLTRSTGGKDR